MSGRRTVNRNGLLRRKLAPQFLQAAGGIFDRGNEGAGRRRFIINLGHRLVHHVQRRLDVRDGQVLGWHADERLYQIETAAEDLRSAGILGLYARSGTHSCEDKVTTRVQLAFDTHKGSSNLAKRSTACVRAFPSSS